jgi:hypothetical protein
MDEDQIPDNLLPWEIEAWKESQVTVMLQKQWGLVELRL